MVLVQAKLQLDSPQLIGVAASGSMCSIESFLGGVDHLLQRVLHLLRAQALSLLLCLPLQLRLCSFGKVSNRELLFFLLRLAVYDSNRLCLPADRADNLLAKISST